MGTAAARTALLAATALVGALACAPAATAANKDDKPNVLVLETDDQTLESLRVMTTTQKLLAAKGTTFDNSFASFPLCCPSRSTLLTGQYAHNHGVFGNSPPFGGYAKLDHANTLAVWLQAAGYRTTHLGKFLNGYGAGNPSEIPPGWSEWYASVDPSTYRYWNYTLNENGTLVNYGADEAEYQTDVYARKAVDIVRRQAESRRPFFLWTAFLAPHSGSGVEDTDDPDNFATPEPAPRHRNRFAAEALPRPASFNELDMSDKPRTIRNRPRFGAPRTAAIRENYQQRLESLLAVDEAIGQILNALASTGELDDTLVVFTSDNGFFHGEHRLQSGKTFLYEPSIRVPLIVRGPGVPRGERRRQLVSNQDLAATIVDAAGARPARTLDGRSLFPVLDDAEVEYGRDLLLEGASGSGQNRVTYSAVRTPRFVYAEYSNGDRELYDLSIDPDQVQSLHDHPAYVGTRSELAARLLNLRTCGGSGCQAHPALKLRLTYGKGRTRSGRTCATGNVRATVDGGDRGRVERASFYADGRKVGSASDAPFSELISRRHLDRGGVSTLRARAVLGDSRLYTPAASVRVC